MLLQLKCKFDDFCIYTILLLKYLWFCTPVLCDCAFSLHQHHDNIKQTAKNNGRGWIRRCCSRLQIAWKERKCAKYWMDIQVEWTWQHCKMPLHAIIYHSYLLKLLFYYDEWILIRIQLGISFGWLLYSWGTADVVPS